MATIIVRQETVGLWAGHLVFVKWNKSKLYSHPDTPRTKLVVKAELC